MIIVNATIVSDAESIRAMQPAIAEMEKASQAEDGCEDYTFSVELNNPDVLRITERWVDMAALQNHFSLPHMAKFQQAMQATPRKRLAPTSTRQRKSPALALSATSVNDHPMGGRHLAHHARALDGSRA